MMEGEMLKCRTPKEWVDAAIACGANPLYVASAGHTSKPMLGILTGCVGVDQDQYPGPYPQSWSREIFAILVRMDRRWGAQS
jgi:hypothetical protein